MSDPLLKIRIPDEDVEIKNKIKMIDKKINENRQILIYLESTDCRNCLLKETIDERRSEITAKFRYFIDQKQTLVDELKEKLFNKSSNKIIKESKQDSKQESKDVSSMKIYDKRLINVINNSE